MLLLCSARQNLHSPVRIKIIIRLAHCTKLFGIINVSYGTNEIGFQEMPVYSLSNFGIQIYQRKKSPIVH